ncbi:MAG: glycoside hydrolase family 99-like domain-containing protein [Phycisphaerales bacterium]|nr:MAG: glycoside hydrolase family 99-like domain-containing protein [Phycisphaerales bacterium]
MSIERSCQIAIAFAVMICVFPATSAQAADEAPAAIGPDQNGRPVVGVYYYPWYRRPGEWRRVMRQHLRVPQQPELGRYRSADPNVVAAHIAQSVRGGIDFWAVSWWGPQQHCDVTFRNAILKHLDAVKLKYAILYESTGRFGRFNSPSYTHWIPDLTYMREHYFDHPSYLKIDGKPVVFVYLTREYFRNKGQRALKEMREKFPDLYLVGDDVFGAGYRSEWAKNFDAVTAYDVYGQSVGRLGGTRKAIEFLAANYRHAKAQAHAVGTAFMPTIAPGYNDTAVRPGHPGRARYFTDVENSQEGDLFRAMIRDVALPLLDPKGGNIMMVTSFNEWYEDTQIEPTAGTAPASTTDDSDSGTYYTGGDRYVDYGYLYLDILREMLD